MSRTSAFSLGLLVASVAGLAWALQRDGAGDALEDRVAVPSWLGGEPEPVLVVVLDGPGAVAGVRDVVDRERIVAESRQAFAVRERRLVAASFDAVGPVLQAAGWRDAPLEIIAPRRGSVVPALAPDPADRVSQLMNKPQLNLLEARALLEVL